MFTDLQYSARYNLPAQHLHISQGHGHAFATKKNEQPDTPGHGFEERKLLRFWGFFGDHNCKARVEIRRGETDKLRSLIRDAKILRKEIQKFISRVY